MGTTDIVMTSANYTIPRSTSAVNTEVDGRSAPSGDNAGFRNIGAAEHLHPEGKRLCVTRPFPLKASGVIGLRAAFGAPRP